MPKKVNCRAAFVLSVLAGPLFGQAPSTIPAFPTQADAVTVDAVALDKGGRPVRGLTREDFILLEDGKTQAIVAFEAREMAMTRAMPATVPGGERVATNEGPGSVGRTFAFLLDDLGTQPLPMEDVKKSIVQWLHEKADPRDEVTLGTVSGDAWWSDRVDRGRADLEAVLGRVRGKKWPEHNKEWISDWEAYRITVYEDATGAAAASAGPGAGEAGGPPVGTDPFSQPGGGRILDRVVGRTELSSAQVRMMAMARYNELNGRVRAVLGATEHLSRGLAGARGRKSILVFSEGFLYDPNQAEMFDRAIDASQRANTVVYFIDAKGLVGDYANRADQTSRAAAYKAPSMEENYLATGGAEQIAENTGGASIRNTNDLFGGLVKIADESSTYYLLGYQPDQSPDGKWHKLEVKVRQPGVKIRTRHGYQATSQPAVASAGPDRSNRKTAGGKEKDVKRPLDPAAVTSGAYNALSLRAASYILDSDRPDLVRVLVVLELDTSRLALRSQGDRRTGEVDLTLLAMNRDQAIMVPLDERAQIEIEAKAAGGWMSLSRELRVAPGVTQVRVLVRDVGSGLRGAVAQRLEVPPPDRPYLSTPILTDRMIAALGKPPRLVPVAYRHFKPQGHLYCSYEVLGITNVNAGAHFAGGFTLRTVAGRVVLQATPTPIIAAQRGSLTRLLGIPLDGLEAGSYELIVDVVDQASGLTLQSRDLFVLG
jgi:VWFA-related protein